MGPQHTVTLIIETSNKKPMTGWKTSPMKVVLPGHVERDGAARVLLQVLASVKEVPWKLCEHSLGGTLNAGPTIYGHMRQMSGFLICGRGGGGAGC